MACLQLCKEKGEKGDKNNKTDHGRIGEAMGADVEREVGVLVKEKEAERELGSVGSSEDIGGPHAPRSTRW